MSDFEEFDNIESGAAQYVPQQMSAFRKNQHIMIKSRPCKIVEMSTSKTGKHGSAKVSITAIDIFTSKKMEDVCPSTANRERPIIKRTDYQLVDISNDGFLSLMLESGDMKEDVKLPPSEDLSKEIRERFDNGEMCLVGVVAACGEEQVIGVKAAAN